MALNKPNKIIVHHTGGTDAQPLADSSNATAEQIDSWHKLRWPGFVSNIFFNKKGDYYHVGYHYVIEKDGKVVSCRHVSEEGAHTIGQNLSSIGICLSGNFDVTMPTLKQQTSFIMLFHDLKKLYPEYNLSKSTIYPHRKYANKTCYGLNLSDTYFNNLIMDKTTQPVIVELQTQVVQLLTQLYALIKNKRYSNKEIK